MDEFLFMASDYIPEIQCVLFGIVSFLWSIWPVTPGR